MTDRPWYEGVPLPQLMRDARDVYRHAVARALAAEGFDDVPRNGPFVLADLDQAAFDPRFSSQADVVASLGHLLSADELHGLRSGLAAYRAIRAQADIPPR